MALAYSFVRTGFVAFPKLSYTHTLSREIAAHPAQHGAQAQRFQNFLSHRVGMASVGGPFQSGHGPVERAGVMNSAGRARANLAGGIPVGRDSVKPTYEQSEANGVSILPPTSA